MSITGLEMIRRDEAVRITGLDKVRAQPDLPDISNFTVQLTELIRSAKEADRALRHNGADIHGYELNPVIPMSRIREFEKKHRIVLPRSFTLFLTQVGNGGAGPDKGVYSLEELEKKNYFNHREAHFSDDPDDIPPSVIGTTPYYNDAIPSLVTSMLTDEKWTEWRNRLYKIKDYDSEEFLKCRHEAYNGLLEIVSSDSSYCVMLVCCGDMTGQVVSFDHNLMIPEYYGLRFDEWMINHFKGIIREYGQ